MRTIMRDNCKTINPYCYPRGIARYELHSQQRNQFEPMNTTAKQTAEALKFSALLFPGLIQQQL